MTNEEQFEEWRKQLGSPRAKIVYEYYQECSIYLASLIFILTGALLIFISHPISNIGLLLLIYLSAAFCIGMGVLLRRAYILPLPKEEEILKKIEENGCLNEFINYLESKLTPLYFCQYLSVDTKIEKFNSSILFSVLTTMYLLFFQVTEKNEIAANTKAIVIGFIVVLYIYLGKNIYQLIRTDDTICTIVALKSVKKFIDKKRLTKRSS